MKKVRKWFLSPDRTLLWCSVYIENRLWFAFCRSLVNYEVCGYIHSKNCDVTTYDLEMHSFLRVSHAYIVQPDSFEYKIEEMFEIDNPNI